MSLVKKILEGHPEFIDTYNDLAPFLQAVVAEEIQPIIGIAIDPNNLPTIRFEDNIQTREPLETKPYTTNYSAKLKRTPFGDKIIALEAHPNAIVRRAEDVQRTLGGKQIKEYMQKQQISFTQLAQHLLDQSAAQIMVEAILIDTKSKVDPTKLYRKALSKALAYRDAK